METGRTETTPSETKQGETKPGETATRKPGTRTETPATRIKKKLRESHPGIRFKVRYTPYRRGKDLVTIYWADPGVKESQVLRVAKTEFDGHIYGHHSPHM